MYLELLDSYRDIKLSLLYNTSVSMYILLKSSKTVNFEVILKRLDHHLIYFMAHIDPQIYYGCPKYYLGKLQIDPWINTFVGLIPFLMKLT